MPNTIHATAIIEDGAKIADDVHIGPYCHVGPAVEIASGCVLKSHVVINGHSKIGSDNAFHPFCVIGGDPQDLTYSNEPTGLEIGNKNIFREGTSVHRGTERGRKMTTIGNGNFIMAYCHIAHDCVLHDNIIMANQTALAGHVEVEDHVFFGGQSGAAQFVRVGKHGFISANGGVRKDLPPFMSAKDFSLIPGPNLVGLRRFGYTNDDLKVVKDLYKIFYLGKTTMSDALARIEEKYSDNKLAQYFINFVKHTKIGVQR